MSLAVLPGMTVRRHLLLCTLLLGACREAASEAEELDLAPPKPPCAGCTLDLPPSTRAVPLLVVLHGNWETAADAAARWRGAALARGWGVLALQCPRAEGCDDQARWYRWRGEPTWIVDQIAEVGRKRPIDESKIYLVGWSGGATYIGMMAPQWSSVFAAVVFHGGGQPPSSDGCPPRALPAYFLVGDKNPAHPAARRLRDYWESCRQEHVWDLVEGANHAREEAALDHVKAMSILQWLDRHERAPLLSKR